LVHCADEPVSRRSSTGETTGASTKAAGKQKRARFVETESVCTRSDQLDDQTMNSDNNDSLSSRYARVAASAHVAGLSTVVSID
jgi:hypothetical protein